MVLAPCCLWETPVNLPLLTRRTVMDVGGQVFFLSRENPACVSEVMKLKFPLTCFVYFCFT